MQDPRMEVVKSLSDQYRVSHDALLIPRILRRIDPLIFHHIRMLSNIRIHLKRVAYRELYNCSVLGLYQAITCSTNEETPTEFQSRLLKAISHEIYVYHKLYYREVPVDDITGYDQIYCPDMSNSNYLLCWELLKYKVVTEKELLLLLHRYIDKVSTRELGIQFHMSHQGMARKVRRIKFKVIRYTSYDYFNYCFVHD